MMKMANVEVYDDEDANVEVYDDEDGKCRSI